jgi:hypothetical protein
VGIHPPAMAIVLGLEIKAAETGAVKDWPAYRNKAGAGNKETGICRSNHKFGD